MRIKAVVADPERPVSRPTTSRMRPARPRIPLPSTTKNTPSQSSSTSAPTTTVDSQSTSPSPQRTQSVQSSAPTGAKVSALPTHVPPPIIAYDGPSEMEAALSLLSLPGQATRVGGSRDTKMTVSSQPQTHSAQSAPAVARGVSHAAQNSRVPRPVLSYDGRLTKMELALSHLSLPGQSTSGSDGPRSQPSMVRSKDSAQLAAGPPSKSMPHPPLPSPSPLRTQSVQSSALTGAKASALATHVPPVILALDGPSAMDCVLSLPSSHGQSSRVGGSGDTKMTFSSQQQTHSAQSVPAVAREVSHAAQDSRVYRPVLSYDGRLTKMELALSHLSLPGQPTTVMSSGSFQRQTSMVRSKDSAQLAAGPPSKLMPPHPLPSSSTPPTRDSKGKAPIRPENYRELGTISSTQGDSLLPKPAPAAPVAGSAKAPMRNSETTRASPAVPIAPRFYQTKSNQSKQPALPPSRLSNQIASSSQAAAPSTIELPSVVMPPVRETNDDGKAQRSIPRVKSQSSSISRSFNVSKLQPRPISPKPDITAAPTGQSGPASVPTGGTGHSPGMSVATTPPERPSHLPVLPRSGFTTTTSKAATEFSIGRTSTSQPIAVLQPALTPSVQEQPSFLFPTTTKAIMSSHDTATPIHAGFSEDIVMDNVGPAHTTSSTGVLPLLSAVAEPPRLPEIDDSMDVRPDFVLAPSTSTSLSVIPAYHDQPKPVQSASLIDRLGSLPTQRIDEQGPQSNFFSPVAMDILLPSPGHSSKLSSGDGAGLQVQLFSKAYASNSDPTTQSNIFYGALLKLPSSPPRRHNPLPVNFVLSPTASPSDSCFRKFGITRPATGRLNIVEDLRQSTRHTTREPKLEARDSASSLELEEEFFSDESSSAADELDCHELFEGNEEKSLKPTSPTSLSGILDLLPFLIFLPWLLLRLL
ncbi:hypothetical protein BC835DRAFT_1410764 [Cytidiella melzeri]|nr:hypothetical protein BC835DRAFT_1410764 [Cytidiella melzeri]